MSRAQESPRGACHPHTNVSGRLFSARAAAQVFCHGDRSAQSDRGHNAVAPRHRGSATDWLGHDETPEIATMSDPPTEDDQHDELAALRHKWDAELERRGYRLPWLGSGWCRPERDCAPLHRRTRPGTQLCRAMARTKRSRSRSISDGAPSGKPRHQPEERALGILGFRGRAIAAVFGLLSLFK